MIISSGIIGSPSGQNTAETSLQKDRINVERAPASSHISDRFRPGSVQRQPNRRRFGSTTPGREGSGSSHGARIKASGRAHAEALPGGLRPGCAWGPAPGNSHRRRPCGRSPSPERDREAARQASWKVHNPG